MNCWNAANFPKPLCISRQDGKSLFWPRSNGIGWWTWSMAKLFGTWTCITGTPTFTVVSICYGNTAGYVLFIAASGSKGCCREKGKVVYYIAKIDRRPLTSPMEDHRMPLQCSLEELAEGMSQMQRGLRGSATVQWNEELRGTLAAYWVGSKYRVGVAWLLIFDLSKSNSNFSSIQFY